LARRKLWSVKNISRDLQKQLVDELKISPILALLLINRGYHCIQAAKKFLNPDLNNLSSPLEINGINLAVRKIKKAISQDEKIIIYGDYDVDGISSTALLTEVFRSLGANVDYYIPDRLEEGYGLNIEALEKMAENGVKLVVTVDCGITAKNEVIEGQNLGLEFIITDHHQPPEDLPPCIIINPALEKDCVPWKDLAGVGVAYKLAQGLLEYIKGTDAGRKEVLEYLDLAALGTIADIVPLIGENRIIVKCGLEQIAQGKRLGIKALCQAAGLDYKSISSGQVGYFLAPRLNACGRIGDPNLGVKLLLASSDIDANEIAQKLNSENKNRQAIEARITKEAMEMVEKIDLEKEKIIVLASKDWHPGVIGIVASRLVEKYYRPTIIMTLQDNIYKGSGRSIPGFHLHQALIQCQELLKTFGGHSQAAGLSLLEKNYSNFKHKINLVANEILTVEKLIPTLEADGEVNLAEVDFNLLNELAKLEPFGSSNPEPLLVYRRGEIKEYREVGNNGGHLKLKVKAGKTYWDAIGFNMAGYLEMAASQEPLDMAFCLDKNQWNGKTSLQLILKDMKPYKEADNPNHKLDFLDRLFLKGLNFLEDDIYEDEEIILKQKRIRKDLSLLNTNDLLRVIKEAVIGNYDYRLKQLETLDLLEKGYNTLAILGTGRGKSAIFQTRAAYLALTQRKTTIIIYPLRSLVNDQYFSLKTRLSSLGLKISKATGSLNPDERLELLANLEKGEIDIVLTTPEFLVYNQDKFNSFVKNLGLIVLDECHYLASRRVGYKLIAQALERLGKPQILAVTATADDRISNEVIDKLIIKKLVIDTHVRENLQLIDSRGCNDKIGYIKNLLLSGERTVVYVNSRKVAYSLAADLRRDVPYLKEKVGYYHGGLTSDDRQVIEDLFRKGTLQLIITTSAFGKGIDIPDIENVVLYHLCFSKEEYNQLAGRAGRNGSKAKIHLLYGVKDKELNQLLLAGSSPNRQQMGQFYILLKKLTEKNPIINFTNAEIAEWAKIYKIFGLQDKNVSNWLGILEELGLIEREFHGNDRTIHLTPNPSKVNLEESIRYLEGLEERVNFDEYAEIAFYPDSKPLLDLINRPIYPH